MSNSSVADTILQQLGGQGPLVAMISAKTFLVDESSLSFRFSGKSKNGANYAKITLDPNDTYTVRFVKIGRAPQFDVTECGSTSMVYADSLREHFERATGFYLSL